MARGEKTDGRKRPGSGGGSRDPGGEGRPRGRSGGFAGAGAAGTGTAPAEARSNRSSDAAGRKARPDSKLRGGSRAPERLPATRRAKAVEPRDAADDAALGGFLDSDVDEELHAGERESLEEPPSDFGEGREPSSEEVETDGPVMGGPGMLRMGADRAVSSGTGGLAAGEDLDPVAEGDYWRENFRRSPYFAAETESAYEPAYRFGWSKAGQYEYRNRGFEEVEIELREEWETSRGADQPWEDAREAAREAWERAKKGRR